MMMDLENYLILQPVFKYFQTFSSTIDKIFGLKSKQLSDTSFAPKFTYIHNSKIAVRFDRNCLKQDKVSFTDTNVVNVLIAHKLDLRSRDLGINFTLKDCFLELLT